MARNRRPRIHDQDLDVREGEPVAAQVFAYDRDSGDTLTYSIVSGNSDGLFQIDPLTGVITRADGGVFDFETDARRYDLRVRVTDDGNPPKSRTADVTIRITDAPDAPHEITVANLSVDENAAGAVIGAVTVADQDDTSHILAVDDARFEIVGGALKLKDGESLDHEAEETVTVAITATDDDGGSLSQSFTITVNDVNEAPTAIALSNDTVAENAIGAVVGIISVIDPDDPLEPFGMHSLSVDDARFELIGSVLKLKDGVSLDHEAADTVSVTVTATDGRESVSQVFEIAVTDVNEGPTAISLSDSTVDEATAGAAVGLLTIADPDDPASPFGSQTITVDDDRFEVASGVLKLKDGISLDHETGAPIPLTVTATDGGGASVTQAFDVTINDVNEAPTAIGLSNATVAENAAGAVIGSVTVVDPDDPGEPFGSHVFSVNDARFEVVDGLLKLRSGFALDHESQELVQVIVTATDAGGASVSQPFDISVTDANDAPTAISLSGQTVDEATPGAAIGTVLVTDPDDPDGSHDITVSDTRFEVVDGVLKLKDGVALDFAAGSTVLVNVTATDSGGLSLTQTQAITVNEIDEAPILTVTSIDSVAEEATGVVVGQARASDPDRFEGSYGRPTLSVDDARFEIVWGEIRLKDGAALDFETEPTVTLAITATDATGLSTTETISLNVRDVADGQTFFSLGALNGSDGFAVSAADSGALGYSVASAGDINGDGFDDVIVGAPSTVGTGNFGAPAGASYVLFGSASGWPADVDLLQLDGSDGFRINPGSAFSGVGVTVSAAGDIDGDGVDDLIVGAAPVSSAAAAAGGTGEPPPPPPPTGVAVVFGKTAGWSPSLDLSDLTGTDGFRLSGETVDDLFGAFVASVGDMNGDGYDDVAIGDLSDDFGGAFAGSSYVLYGTPTGWPAEFDESTLDGTNGFRVDGIAGEAFAANVGTGGDINGDGYDDLLVGSLGYDGFGSAYVVFGQPSAVSPTVSLSSLDGANGFQVTGLDAYFLPAEVNVAGDVNGDGIEDIIIGSASDQAGGYDAGAAFVVFGQADGWPASLDVSALDGTNGFRIAGSLQYDLLGIAAGSAGDVNGDGLDDLLVGAPGALGNAGAAYVVYGQADGFAAEFDLQQIDGRNGFQLDGVRGDYPYETGFAAESAGDINGDGFDDVIVGANSADPGGNSFGGEAYVFFGGDFTSDVTQLGSDLDDTLTGTSAADSLVGAQGDDILQGNGGADVLYGGAGDDILAVGDLSFARIDGGSGTDTLRVDGAGEVLDLTATGNTKIAGIEQIDLTGSGDNTLTLAVTDLLALSDDSSDLFVSGDAGDQVTGIGAWQSDGAVTVDGVTYNVYSVAGVAGALYVEDDIVFTTAATTGV